MAATLPGDEPNKIAPVVSVPAGAAPREANSGISRRDILRTLAIGAAAGGVLQVIPAEAAEYIHELVRAEKIGAAEESGSVNAPAKYVPKYFTGHQYATLIFLCDAIIPPDEHSGGAVEGGAPEFIDLLTSENENSRCGWAAVCCGWTAIAPTVMARPFLNARRHRRAKCWT